jgi:hypothetical protein
MRQIVRFFVLTACLVACGSAELSTSDRAVIREMTRGSLYLRNNVPCRFTSGMGIGAEVVTEVSPTGIDWEKNLNASAASVNKRKLRRGGVNTIYWGFGPNDIIQYGKLYFRGGGVVELWAEGVKPKDVEIWIRFVGIGSREDFKKAYDLILSNKPLQDEHPEWPSEIATAIAARRVMEGMTKAQAFVVVGTPIAIDRREEAGQKIETWFPRQDTGTSGSWGSVTSSTTGFPASLRFVDGKLATIVNTTGPAKPNLDQ